MAIFSKIATGVMAMAASASALDHVVAKGSQFVYETSGSRFEIMGAAYQPGGSAGFGNGIDPLSNGTTCLRDASIMQAAGVNTIRVYNLDPALDHDACVSVFNAAGIYMILDVNSPLPGGAINAAEPWTTYTKDYLTRVFQVIDAFKNYDNLIGFFSGNEMINDITTGGIDPPYIRAVTRDMKNYIAKQCDRAIPVGYSAADVRDILVDTNNYLQCTTEADASDDLSRIDFFGLNSYSWCGNSSIQTAGYDTLMTDFSSSTVPVFFSEYGCNAVTPRPFTEIGAIYGADMRETFSGGIAYEWTQETNNYGLVKVASDASVTLMQDYENMAAELAKLDKTALAVANASATGATPVKCEASLIKTSSFSNNFTLPAMPAGVQDLIDNGVTGGKTGAMSAPSSTKCPVTVYGVDNKAISNLGINIVAGAETSYSSNSSSSSNSTGSGSAKASGYPIAFLGTGTAASAGSYPTGNSSGIYGAGSGSGAAATSASAPAYQAATMTPSPSVYGAGAGAGAATGYGSAASASTSAKKSAISTAGAPVATQAFGAAAAAALALAALF